MLYKLHYLLARPASKGRGENITDLRVKGDRASWEQAFIALWEPLYVNGCFSKGKSQIRIRGPQIGSPGIRGGRYEAFARSFIGVSFFLHNRKDGMLKLSNGSEVDISALYREGIVNGTNPKHREYWGRIKSPIRLVENCSIAIGLLLTRNLIWDRFRENEKENIKRWFELQSSEPFSLNNWQWFKVFHHLFLEEACQLDQGEAIAATLRNIMEMHNGSGWYSDGMPPHVVYDYYSCWAMQYYALMFSYIAGDGYDEWKKSFIDNARTFFSDYRHFFSPDAQPPLYGRSQIYRWASLAPWGPALKLDVVVDGIQAIKELLVGSLNTFIAKGAARKDGILGCGYFREFQPMMEEYSSPGSPYWAFNGFSLLMLPDDHPFWGPSEEENSPLGGVHTMKGINACISNDGTGHVILHPNITLERYINDVKYNKYAYSNTFLLNYDKRFPVDNSIILQGEGGEYYRRVANEVVSCADGTCVTRWRACGKREAVVLTALAAKAGGYVISHTFYGEGPVHFHVGGFPLAIDQADVHVSCAEEEIILRAKKGEVGMRLLSGSASPNVYTRRNVNPDGKYSHVPYFQGTLRDGERISIEAWGRKSDQQSAPGA
ncbi:MAG: DUF2264 domain-containing protein [Actinobacteria bacterium]|nr:DUF2264 domain-containing protein [Actinomycetota bacterium]